MKNFTEYFMSSQHSDRLERISVETFAPKLHLIAIMLSYKNGKKDKEKSQIGIN